MILKDKSIFIPGGAGFIGLHTAERLAEQNQVTIYDNFSSASVPINQITKKIKIIKGDIRNEKKLSRAMKGHDIVINFAVAHLRLSFTKPYEVHDVNTTGMLSALRAAKLAGIKRYIYISSSEIYGSATTTKISESDPKNPTTIYGVSKYVGELYTQYFNNHEGLQTMIIRLFNTYGPRAHFEKMYGEVIPRMCIRALAGLPPLIFGNGTQTRDFTHIDDSVHGILLAASDDTLLGDVVNIAFGEEISLLQIAKAICKATGCPNKFIFQPSRPNDVQRHAADTTKAQKLLGWKPKINIEDGIANYVTWLRKTYPNPKKLLTKIPEKNW